MEKISFCGLPNCYRIFNDNIDLVATTDVGLNIIRFGFVGDRNEFLGKVDFGFAGHILRHAPEAQERIFFGNDPIAMEKHDRFIRLTQPTEIATGIQKEMDLPVLIEGNNLKIVHRLYNRGLWPVKLAPWTSSLMQGEGRAIFPLTPRGPHSKNTLLPTSLIAIWPYCDLSDSRLVLGKKYVMLKHDNKVPDSYKLGMLVSDGWTAYYNDSHLFVITFDYKNNSSYPDFGCSVEAFSGTIGLELETLGPLTLLPPNSSVDYEEKWFLFRGIPEPKNDDDIDQYILPLIHKIGKFE